MKVFYNEYIGLFYNKPMYSRGVSPDTFILTRKGYFPIKLFKDKKISVWNGHEFSEVTVKQTGTNQELVQVDFNNGLLLVCTLYHRFHIERPDGSVNIVMASDLKPNDQLITHEFPTINNINSIQNTDIPVNASISYKLEWIAKHLDFTKIIFTKDQLERYRKIILLLQTLGCHPRISIINPEIYQLQFSNNTVTQLKSLGLPALAIFNTIESDTYNSVNVIRITKLDVRSDTYCFTECFRHIAIFNGIIAGQCDELEIPIDMKIDYMIHLDPTLIGKFRNIFPNQNWHVFMTYNDITEEELDFIDTFTPIFQTNNDIAFYQKINEYTLNTGKTLGEGIMRILSHCRLLMLDV